MSIVEKTNQELEVMTKTERQVGSYFLRHPNDFAFYTLDKIARVIGTSTTTIIRFCRRVGFAGYKEFQDQLREEMKYQVSLPERLERSAGIQTGDELLSKVMERSIQSINSTFSEISLPALSQAVASIEQARRVFVFGMRESLAIAHYTYTRLVTVRSNVFLLNAGYNGMLEPILDLTTQDVCIFFLFHRYTDQSRYILPLLKEQGVQIILITSPPYDLVEPFADILLPCHVETQGIKNTSAAPICLADYFCNAVAMRNSQSALARLKQIEDLLQHNGTLGS